jgi:hypothetical protein
MEGSERAVRVTIAHILNLLETGAAGAARMDPEVAQSLRGAGSAISMKTDEIVEQVLKQL